jgi:glutaredoxin-related protein
MEGSVDAPRSQLSNNLVKILTGVQAFPLVSVDVLEHPAIMGYTVHRSGSHCTPHVYVNGTFFGDYDMILRKFKSGELQQLTSTTATKNQPVPVGRF